MQTAKKFDITSTLLVLFIFLLVSLFYYLYNVEKSITNYSINHDKIITLDLLNKELNAFCLAQSTFTNYDKINQKISRFETTLYSLEKNIKDQNKNKELFKTLQKIQTHFKEKKENIEYFKSLNASLISGSHFLFDLQKSISEEKCISAEVKNLINETLFFILRYTTSSYIDKTFILKKLHKLNKYKTSDKAYIQNFYIQSTLLVENVSLLKKVSYSIYHSQINESIQQLHKLLDKHYEKNIFIQKLITTSFFIFTIIILLILIIAHMQSLKNKKELYAFKYAVQHTDNSIIITDAQRYITFVNEVFEKTTGYAAAEVLGKNPSILKSDQHSTQFYQELNSKLNKGEKWEGEFINRRKDGTIFYEKASIVPIFLNKKLQSYLAIKLDITKYVEQNMKLAQAATVFENTEEAIIIADKNGHVTSINSAFSNIYGYTLDEVKGKNLNILHPDKKYDKEFYEEMWNQIINNGQWRGKILNKSKDGEIIPVWTTIKKILDKYGNVVNYTGVQTDLREIENSQAKADYLAYHDSLTGLYNRVNFEEYLSHALSVAHRNNTILAILFIDLDRFKVINDTLGHDIGDKVLINVASRLKNTLRESDFISRWGGDEFVVILEELSDASEAAIVATNIIEILKEPMYIENHHLITTASVGIALYPENGQNANTLIKHADSAMYLAKDMGKNNFQYYTNTLSKEIKDKLKIDMALHNAISNNEIYMLFQPQYSLKENKIISVEALVRWENQEMGFISPDKFIPIAEDSGIIISLGYFIFEESCKAFKKMKDANVALEKIAINVSSIQFKETHLLDTFLAIAKRHNINASEIEIEITERFIMENSLSNANRLKNFREQGFTISIDDFGTGYSSMSYLKHLPIDTIKIDKSFVDDIADGSSDNVIIEAIIALSKTLGYSIVAEGIETVEQEEFLRDAMCDIGQGYLFSKPISCEEIIEKFV
jgi:diguanylate cyclase (GGDEF)-like protein/PAS domain S-box-containing protein